MRLPTFDGPHPGQCWVCYTPKNQPPEQLVGPMLQRNFQKPDIAPNTSRTFLRVKQKELDRAIWELDGNVHKGAHFPLAIWTIGNSYRSAEAAKRRAMKKRGRLRAEVSAGAEVSAPEPATAAEAVAVDNAMAPANAVNHSRSSWGTPPPMNSRLCRIMSYVLCLINDRHGSYEFMGGYPPTNS